MILNDLMAMSPHVAVAFVVVLAFGAQVLVMSVYGKNGTVKVPALLGDVQTPL